MPSIFLNNWKAANFKNKPLFKFMRQLRAEGQRLLRHINEKTTAQITKWKKMVRLWQKMFKRKRKYVGVLVCMNVRTA